MKQLIKNITQHVPWLGSVLEERDWLRSRVAHLEPYKTWQPPGHFYSPLPDLSDIKKRGSDIFDRNPQEIAGIDLNIEEQMKLLKELQKYKDEFSFPEKLAPGSYYPAFPR